ncbi:hypothetical protein L6164_025906 [Bauhinia variegata]|uniref:Uncharacterized protein n=1 Tax=Bauhinia variegata TaxID=167791 RepID=A0ACB9M299_BAUVA|nr:hypothetical protein L6164_025906 [Bauhinia variegata]
MLENSAIQPIIEEDINKQDEESQPIATRRPRREIRRPARYSDNANVVDYNPIAYALAVAENIDSDEPQSYKEAFQHSKPVCTPLATHFKFDASITPSTKEDKEYMSRVPYSSAVGSLMYAMGLIDSLGLDVPKPIIYCDSQSALCLAKNPVYHERSKHIDVKLNFIRDIIENDDFTIEKIATADNPADMLTKPLPTEKFKHSLDLVNVRIV